MISHARGTSSAGPPPPLPLSPGHSQQWPHQTSPAISPFSDPSPGGVRHEAGLTSENTRSSGHGGFPLSFAPQEAVSRAIDDWFEKIHPVAPILPRRRFLRRYVEGEATQNPIFCGLVASICAATAATLPREHYGPITVTSSVDFIERNRLLVGGFFQASSSTLDWCVYPCTILGPP